MRRLDDVAEQNGCEHTVGGRYWRSAGEEGFDLIQHVILERPARRSTGNDAELCGWDVLGQVFGITRRDEPVVDRVKDQSRGLHCREYGSDVGLHGGVDQCEQSTGTDRCPEPAFCPSLKRRIRRRLRDRSGDEQVHHEPVVDLLLSGFPERRLHPKRKVVGPKEFGRGAEGDEGAGSLRVGSGEDGCKQLTNIRTTSKDEAVRLTPPIRMTLEKALAYIEDDELVEVTPKSVRLRKKLLDPNDRKREERRKEAEQV